MATTNTVTINEIPVDSTDPTKTAWGSLLSNQYFFVIANGTAAGETFDAADISAATRTRMATYKRGISVNMNGGDDTVIGSAYGDTINAGEGINRIDGGANEGTMPGGGRARDVLNVFAANQAAADALSVTAIEASATGADGAAYAAGYRIKVSNGAETDYLKNVEQVNVFLAGANTFVKTIRLAVDVYEIDAAQPTANAMHMAWAQGSDFADTFNAAADVSAATQALMTQNGRGVWADTGAGDDVVTGSGYGDDINAGAGTNYVDGGANAGSPPWGGKALDVLHVTVASQAAADAVAVTQLSAASTGLDAQAFANGYTHKVSAGADTNYIKGIERVSIEVGSGNSSTWARDIPLAVVVQEANLADSNIANYYHLAWVNGTADGEAIDLSGGSALLSAEVKAAMAARGRGLWVDGGAGNDTITGTAYADNFRNGSGNAKIDGGANAGPNGTKGQDVFEITVASTTEMNAVQVVASDDSVYTWMVTYGSGSSQKDYLKNIEAIVVNVAGTGTGKWIPLAVNVHEIAASGEPDKSMHFAWAQGTAQGDSFDAGTDVSAATRTLMGQKGRGVWVDLGEGNDTAVGSGYGDDFSMGAGTNYVDGGANAGSPPWGGKAADVLHVTVASQAAADAVTVVALGAGLSGLDAQAYTNGYTHKVAAGGETDYIKGIERVSVQVDTGNGNTTWARDIPLAVVVQEANLADSNIANYYHLGWVNGTADGEAIDLSGDSALLSAELKAAMAARGRGLWVDGGAGNDTITGTAYADNFRNGGGNAKIDGGANAGPNGTKGQDVFEITVASTAEMNAVQVVASDDSAYTWMVTYGSGSSQKDYLKNIEAIVVNVAGSGTGKWIPLAMTVQEIAASGDLDKSMHFAWAQGSAQADSFNAGTDVSAATRTLMAQKGRGVWVDLGEGNDTAVGSGYGDDFNMGAGTNYVDGGANAGTPPYGGKAADVLHVTVASQAAADAVAVTALGAGLSGLDAQAYANGYTHKVMAGGETDYIKGIERVVVQIDSGSGTITWAREVRLALNVTEANLSDTTQNYVHLAWIDGTETAEIIDASGDTALLSAELKAAMAARGRGVWINGGAGDDVITGTAYADEFVNGAGNARIDGGANAAPDGARGADVFQIVVGSTAEMDAVRVVQSDDPAYTWMVTYGANSSQKDYLKNIEAVTIAVNNSSAGKWIPLALTVHEVQAGAELGNIMHFAWADGTTAGETFNANSDVSAATRTLMSQWGRGVRVDMGAGNDTVVGSAYGDNIVAGSGVNYIDGGANMGTLPGGGNGQPIDVLEIYVADQAAADAVSVTELTAAMTGADGEAYAAGYRLKIANGTSEVDYVRNVERIHVSIWNDKNGDGMRQYFDDTNPANEVSFVRAITPPSTAPVTPNTAPSFTGVPPGVAVTDAGRDFGAVAGIALASGKLLSLSYLHPDGGEYVLVLNRSNADGSVDTSFGSGGRVLVPTSYNLAAAPVEVAGGKVLVAVSTFGSASDFRVLRLNADGTLDNTFGTGGATTVSFSAGIDQVRKLVVDSTGKIVVVGNTESATGRDMAILRLTADGALDTGFNGSGKATVSLGAGPNLAIAAAAQADGKLVVVGYAPTGTAGVNQVAALRMNADGSLDTTFGNGGKVLLPLAAGPNNASAVQVLADGRILLGASFKSSTAGTADWDPALVMLTAGGALDASFGTGGIAKAHPSDLHDTISGIQVQPDGKIVILGSFHYAPSNLNGALLVARYNANGTPDISFGSNGAVAVSVHGIGDQPAGLALADGKIVVFGSAINDTSFNTSNIIVRLNGDGTPDASFGAANPSSLGGTVRAGMFGAYLDQNAAVFDAEMAARGHYGGASLTLVRHGGQNAEDLFIGAGEVRLADGNVSVAGIVIGTAVQSGGKLDITFNEQATQGLVNRALHGLVYLNTSATPPASVVVDWTFSDNNSGGQGTGGALAATGSTTVEIGIVTSEVRRSMADPALTAEHTQLSQVAFLANVTGTNAADTFDSATGFSPEARGLMDQLQRGARFETGAGNDTVTGTAYSDEFTLGTGVNRVDGGGQAGSHPFGGAGRDVLQVFVTSDAAGAAVSVTSLDASATGADKEAFDAGYTVKVVNGSETDYTKNIESIVVQKWVDANGNKLRDEGETTWLHDFSPVLRVNEVQVNSSDPTRDTGGHPLAQNMHMAWAFGWNFADSFNADTNVSAATRALMAQYGRGVFVDTGAGDDTIVGSGYGDNITAGTGVNRVDGGANAGTNPTGGPAYDDLSVYAAEPGKVTVTALTSGMSGADADAFAAGYTYKIFAGAEIDYVKNIESVTVFQWTDANGNGVPDGNEGVTWSHRVALSMLVNEIAVSATDPTRDPSGNPLSTYAHFAWVDGSPGADNFSVEANVSGATRGLMAQVGRGIHAWMGAGDDVVSGSNWGDHIVAGSGTNKIDGGANQGFDQGGQAAADTLQMFVADQATADAVTVTLLTSAMSGADGAAFAEGYRYKVANGTTEVNYVKNVENLDISIWQDKNGNGRPDYGGGDANEATNARWIRLAENTAPTFSTQPGVVVTDSGYDLTTYGFGVLADGKILSLSIADTVAEGSNYVSVLTRHNPDGSLDASFGGGGAVFLPVTFGIPSRPLTLADGKLLMAVSTNLSNTADFKVVRLNANGTVDTTFGSNGEAVVSLSDGNDVPRKMLALADGKVLVTGSVNNNADFGVIRLNADGSLDTSFNGNGKLVVPLSDGPDGVTSAVLQADGKLLLAGFSGTSAVRDFAVVRVNLDGSLDASFGSGGKVVLPVGPGTDAANAIAVQADGKIVLGGASRTSADTASDTDLSLVRLKADGSLDTSFGNGGKVMLHQSAANDGIGELLVQPDGKIVTAGWSASGTGQAVLTVMRFNADGSLDTGFGKLGVASAAVHGVDARPAGLALVDGKIVVGGSSYYNLNFDASLVLARLNPDGSFDASFGVGRSSVAGTVKSDGLHPVVLDMNALVYDAEMAANNDYGGASVTLARRGGANPEDVFSAAGEVRFEAGRVKVAGVEVGWLEQAAGSLTLHFHGGTTQGMLDRALHGIAYANSSSTPPASVIIDWLFADNNPGWQGMGGSLTASASTTVQIGVVVQEAVRAYADPALAADGRPLAGILHLATVNGTAGADTVSGALVSNSGRALMDEFKHGVVFDTGAGDDTIVGTGYGDLFIAGAGVNRIDGGANLGLDLAGAAAVDILDVFVADAAAAAGVSPVALSASMSGADLDAFNAGYTHKLVAGGETDYFKGIESVRIWTWQDKDGDGVRDVSNDPNVNEVTLVGTQAIPPSGA